MSPPVIERAARMIAGGAAATALAASLAGCSDLYFDRRETIALGAGDAIAANIAEQTVDPWPPHSGNVAIATNGAKIQSAVERYRTNKVTPPVNAMAAVAPNQPSTAQSGNGGSSSSSSGQGGSQ
jgi:hypothetical protein